MTKNTDFYLIPSFKKLLRFVFAKYRCGGGGGGGDDDTAAKYVNWHMVVLKFMGLLPVLAPVSPACRCYVSRSSPDICETVFKKCLQSIYCFTCTCFRRQSRKNMETILIRGEFYLKKKLMSFNILMIYSCDIASKYY